MTSFLSFWESFTHSRRSLANGETFTVLKRTSTVLNSLQILIRSWVLRPLSLTWSPKKTTWIQWIKYWLGLWMYFQHIRMIQPSWCLCTIGIQREINFNPFRIKSSFDGHVFESLLCFILCSLKIGTQNPSKDSFFLINFRKLDKEITLTTWEGHRMESYFYKNVDD